MKSLEEQFSPERAIQRLGLQVNGVELSDQKSESELEAEFDWTKPPPEFFEHLPIQPGGFPKPEEVRSEAESRVK